MRRVALTTRVRTAGVMLLGGVLAACGSEDFPGAPSGSGTLNVPYVTTYNFGFQVRFDPVLGVEGNLQIISGGDLINLISAANITRLPGTGVISGTVYDTTDTTAGNVVLAATDVNGRGIGQFFYNSLGGTPDFVQTRGTTTLGGFTAFNVAPGEVFLKAVAGGRGGTRLLAFPDEVSLGTVTITPVVVPVIGVVGQITNDAGGAITGSPIGVEVVGQRLSEAVNCADESPTQDRVDAPAVERGTVGFRFCVASEGDYYARLSGDSFVPTYQFFDANSSELTALQTAELTEFMTIQTRDGLDAAARVAGTTWDTTKGVLAGQVRYGAGAPRRNAIVRITDDDGRTLVGPGLGALVYMDETGRPAIRESTGPGGRFVALNLPIPASKTIYVTTTVEEATAGVPVRYVNTSIVPMIPNAVTFHNIDTLLLPTPITGEDQFASYFTGPVSGRVMREDGLGPVANARITPLGVPIAELPPPQQTQVFVASAEGRYFVSINGNAAATTPLLQSSTYLVKVEGPTPGEYLPTYQRVTTGTSEVDAATNQFRDHVQNLVAVTSQAIDQIQQSVNLAPEDRNPDLGILLGTAVDVSSGQPAGGTSIRLTPVDGSDASQASGQTPLIYYFDFGGVPRRDLTATTQDGRFIVFNAPLGTVSLDVTSPEDTGNVLADSRAGGVTYVTLDVNNSPPRSVDVSGTFAPLTGQSLGSGGITLSVAGGDPLPIRQECPPNTFERGGVCYSDPENLLGLTGKVDVPCDQQEVYGPYRVEQDGYCQLRYQSASAAGLLTVPLGSWQDNVLKTSGPGLMDTYTFGVRTTDRAVNGLFVGAVETGAMTDLARAASVTRGDGTAVIWGQTTTASLGEVDENGDPVPLTCANPAWTELPDNSVVGCNKIGTPGAFVTGSFNDDTFRDLAIIDTATQKVTIWLNTGDEAFVLAQEVVRDSTCRVEQRGCGVEGGPLALLVVDYTRDGVSDLVVLNRDSVSISLLEGRGRGQFVFGGSLVVDDVGRTPTAMAAADFNRDQIPDLMITDASGTVGFLLGTGGGFKTPAPGIDVGEQPRAILSGQLDFDGIPDLVFVNSDSISVMQQVGVTNRLTQYRRPSGATPDFSAAAIGDVDGDGFNDVVVADRAAGDPKIWVFVNSVIGDQLFLPPTSLQAGQSPAAVATIDLNGDRTLDLVVLNGGDGTVMYLEADGVGGFSLPLLLPVGGQPAALVMDDVTGDGKVDAVLADPGTGSGRMVILPQTTRPVDGIAVAAVQADGQAVGDVVYLDDQGTAPVATTVTGQSGKFAIFNVPPGPIWLRLLNGGLGSRFLQAYADAVTNTTFPVIKGQTTTTTISGFTADAVLRPVGEVQIRFLGTQRATSSNPIVYDSDGNAVGGANYAAIVEANSDYVIKLSK
ncbi:MAG: VCBS repeat-containing protein [Nitrospirota bacterium]